MKLADLIEETIWEGELDGVHHSVILLNELISIRPSRGGIVSQTLRKGAAAIKSNPGLAALSAGLAVASYTAYSKNKRNHIKLFASNMREKKMYQTIVNDLMKSGGYKKIKEKRVGGGWLWELKKK